MALTQKYSYTAPTSTFSFTDLIQGRAYQTFYPAVYVSSGAGIQYILSPNQIYSTHGNRITQMLKTGTNTMQLIHNLDFEIEMGRPLQIEGDINIIFPFGVKYSSGDNNSLWELIHKYEIFHVDTSNNATSLGSIEAGPLINIVEDTFPLDDRLTGSINVARTKFGVGEILRVNVKQLAKGAAETAHFIGIGHDPQNLGAGTASSGYTYSVMTNAGDTQAVVNVPIVADII